MANIGRQDERSWWVSVPIQASDSLADVQTRLLDHIKEGAESRASAPIPRSLALRLLAEADEVVAVPTTIAAESGSERERDAVASEPVGRGYQVTVTTHRVPPLMCSFCEREIIPGTRYMTVRIGCQTFRVHDACLAWVQRQIAQAL